MTKTQTYGTWKAWLAALIGLISIGSITGCGHDPSVAELRREGYPNCRKIQNSVPAQADTSGDIKCIQDGKLIAFKDSPYNVFQ
jgi:hypothetical protein